MVKRNIKIMAALALAITLGAGAADVHAAKQPSNPAANSSTKAEYKMKGNRKCGARFIYSVLENKLGYTEAQIDEAAKSEKIDKKVSKGRITKDKAAVMKANLKTRIQKWDGCLDCK